MGEKLSGDTKRPAKEANRVSKLLDIGLNKHERFPVNLEKVALELTPAFNPDPITNVQAGYMGKVEGILTKHPDKNEWAIFYNKDIAHKGRTNFTLAHELGHYFVHRHQQSSDHFECSVGDILNKNKKNSNIEAEANIFASNLLMPNHDFRAQIEGENFSFDLIQHCANRYGVSLTAAILKWLDFSDKGAIVILSEDGFMHWSKSNNRAFNSGKYFATRKDCIEIPKDSIASKAFYSPSARSGVHHKSGIWFENDPVIEFSIYSDEYDKTITVLILNDTRISHHKNTDEEEDLLI